MKGVDSVSDNIVDFSACKDLKEKQQELTLFKEMYYELARAVETAIECDTKRETDKLLVVAQRLAEYKYLSYYLPPICGRPGQPFAEPGTAFKYYIYYL